MLEQLERFFPGFLSRLRQWPPIVRAAFLIATLSGVPGLAWLYEQRATVDFWLKREVLVSVHLVVAVGLASAIGAMALRLVSRRIKRRCEISRFLKDWLGYQERLKLLCITIDGYLHGPRKATEGLEEIERMLPLVDEYWQRRGRVRERTFAVGESRLVSLRSARWEALKAKSGRIREGGYLTPFSFLADLGAPIAEWNHHHDEIWEALHIADEFVEYLRFEYPAVKRPSPVAVTSNAPYSRRG